MHYPLQTVTVTCGQISELQKLLQKWYMHESEFVSV